MKSPTTLGEMAAAFALLLAAATALEIREPGKVEFSMLSKALNVPESPKPPGTVPQRTISQGMLQVTGNGNSADSLQDEIHQMQVMHSIRLEEEKNVYEKKLKAQEDANKEMDTENAQLTKDIKELKQTNAKLYQNARSFEKDISVRRQEVALLTGQLKNSVNLMTNAYAKSDTSKLKELDVLREATDADKKKFTALLSIKQVGETDALMHSLSQDIINDVSSSTHDQDAEVQEAVAAADAQEKNVMAKLLAGVQDMRAHGKEQEEQLKNEFLKRKAALDNIHKAVAAKNEELKATLNSEKAYAARLIEAVKTMKLVKASLDTQISDGSLFMKQLGNVAARKPKVAVQQLEAAKEMVAKKQ